MIDKSELKKQILFRDLKDAELGMIVKKMTVEKYSQGKAIFKEGSPTKGLYLIHKGKVEISKITADGWKQTLAIFPENHFLGELSVVEDRKLHGVDATAIEDSEIYQLTKEDFKSFEDVDCLMMYKIMRTIAQIASKNLHSMNERLMKLLISY